MLLVVSNELLSGCQEHRTPTTLLFLPGLLSSASSQAIWLLSYLKQTQEKEVVLVGSLKQKTLFLSVS